MKWIGYAGVLLFVRLLFDNFAIGGSSEIESRGLARKERERKDVTCGEFSDPRATRMLRHGVVVLLGLSMKSEGISDPEILLIVFRLLQAG